MRIYKINMKKQYIIYKTTNIINNKIYVGKDEYNNPEYLGSGKLLHLAIKKYSKENFLKEIIETCKTPEEHSLRETYWINKLPCLSPLGYNIAVNSFGGDTYTHHPNKELYSKRISDANKGKIRTPEMIERYSNCKMGNLNPAKRDDVKIKISEGRKNKLTENENPMFNSNRTRDKLKDLDIELKGDRWEYLRNKIKCINIERKEEFILDGVQEVLKKLKISKNKYYTYIKTQEPIKDKFVCIKI